MQFLIGSLFGSKRDLLDLLLNKGMVMVHLDARCDGVNVPAVHGNDHHLRLNLSLNFGIDDFAYDADGVSASLSFRGQRHFCVLPWHAIFAITSHVEPIGYLWPEDLPPELATRLNAAAPGTERRRDPAEGASHEQATAPGSAPRPSLRLVREDGQTTAPQSPATPSRVAPAEVGPVSQSTRRIARPSSGPVPAAVPLETAGTDDEVRPEEAAYGTDQGRRYGHLRVVK